MNDIAAEAHVQCGSASPRGRRIPRSAPLPSLGALAHFHGSSNFDLGRKARVVFGVVGIFSGACACSSSAVAEVEEDTSRQVDSSGYSATTLSSNTMTKLFIDSATDDNVSKYLSNLNNSHGETEYLRGNVEAYTSGRWAFPPSKSLGGFDDALIPATVWSLDGGAGAHLERIQGGPGTEIYAAFGGRSETPSFSAIFGLWGDDSTNDDDTNNAFNMLFSPPQFQVASCGGSSAEHSNLEYCNADSLIDTQLYDNQLKHSNRDISSTSTQIANSSVPSSNTVPISNLTVLPNIDSLPTTDNIIPLQGTFSLLGLCNDVSVACTIVLIDKPEASTEPPSTDSPPPAVDDLTPLFDPPSSGGPPPGPAAYTSDPEPVLDLPPYITPDPPRPIPEASTWVMTITGFTTMFFVFRKKRRSRLNPISIIDVS